MEPLFFSIIIPTYNRPEQLAKCLQSVVELDYPHEHFEVIVVDDGSQMSLEDVVFSFRQFINITLLRQPNSGPATARNAGANQAKGKFLAFTDDDCKLEPKWLKTLAKGFVNSENMMIGGYTVNILINNLYSIASQTLIDYLYKDYDYDTAKVKFFTSNNFALTAKGFNCLGGFDTNFPLAAGEDREFCERWQHKGYKMIYIPEAIVYHSHELTLTKFSRQHFNYGRGIFCLQKTRINRQSGGIKFESITFYVNLLSYPFRKLKSNQKIFIFGLFILSQISTTVGLIWEIAYQYKFKKTI
jgi:GT2 family glycosyltransferase